MEDGTADPFYQRFTTGKQAALILGNSKAAQGILPSVLNQNLQSEFGTEIYNYSFTVYNSPYGPVYLESLTKKLEEQSKGGYFVVTVDPWSIASDIHDPNNSGKFAETNGILSAITNVNSSPNLQYLLFWFDNSYFEIIVMRMKNNFSKLHTDGWFEVIAGKKSASAVLKRRKFMEDFYNDYLTKLRHSKERFIYLQKTIEFLKTKGPVFLIRMPLHQEILNIEESLDPDFDSRMDFLSRQYGVPYFDFNDLENRWEFKDGLHLTVESAKDFSEVLSNKIRDSTFSNRSKNIFQNYSQLE